MMMMVVVFICASATIECEREQPRVSSCNCPAAGTILAAPPGQA